MEKSLENPGIYFLKVIGSQSFYFCQTVNSRVKLWKERRLDAALKPLSNQSNFEK